MKHILILIADYGYGHRSAANAIAQALQETHDKDCSVEIVKPMDHPSAPAVLRNGVNGYNKLVRAAPDLYKLGTEGLLKIGWYCRSLKISLTLARSS